MSISEKLNKLEIPEEEEELIIEDGLRYRILESENELRKINSEIRVLEDMFGKKFESLKEDGLPDDADYKVHESFMDLEALVYDRIELETKIEILRNAHRHACPSLL